MRGDMKRMNAVRSGIVVLGALAFGYLTLRLGFKPYLERAQADHDLQNAQLSSSSSASHSDDLIDRFPDFDSEKSSRF